MSVFLSHSEMETMNFAEEFAKNLKVGDVIILSGELGARKNKICSRSVKAFSNGKGNL